MRLHFERNWNSILEAVSDAELPDFVVLSGPNGSGKSHLLESIAQGATTVEGVPATPGTQAVRLFTLAQLVAPAEGVQAHATFRERWVQLHQQTAQVIAQFTGPGQNILPGSDQLEQAVQAHLVSSRQIADSALRRMLEGARKRLIDMDVDDFRIYSPPLIGIRDLFGLTVGELFLTYHDRKRQNKFHQWLATTNEAPAGPVLTDEQFVDRFGPPPWTLFNETLALVGLDYEFFSPQGFEENLTYEARPVHRETGTSVAMAQLSSGEKTLMAVAMSLYAGSRLGETIELPKVLLLDEADASLHPSMVQSLLRVADDVFCRRYGVKVLLATHSPTTVALAPEESIYTMRRSGHPRLRYATRDEALQSLTVGIPTLSVRIENRRQVFTESEYDAACYQDLFGLIGHRLKTPISLQFIASGAGGAGGSGAVKHLVTKLRGAGNTSIWGVVDRDNRSGAPPGILFVGGRHSIENLILDPLALGAFLLRERVVDPSEMSLPPDLRHFELTGEHAQRIADFVVERIQQVGDDTDAVTVSYLGGFSITVPRFYLDTPGHVIENRLTSTFQPLKGHGTNLKSKVVERAMKDVPDYVPVDVVQLFRQLLDG